MWEEFEKFLTSQNVNPNTVKAYAYTVRKFVQFLGETSPLEATKVDVSSFLSKYSPNSRARHLAALKAFYSDFLGKPEVVRGFRIRWERRELDFWLTRDQVSAMISLAGFVGLRERAMIRLGYDLALRVGEVVALNRRDLDGQYLIVTVLKKRGRQARVRKRLYPQTLSALREYLSIRADDNPAMFVSRRGRRMSTDTAQHAFRRVCKLAGIELPKGVGFHVLRHSRAAHLREQGVPLDVISKFLDHSLLQTTMIYAHIGPSTIEREVPAPGF